MTNPPTTLDRVRSRIALFRKGEISISDMVLGLEAILDVPAADDGTVTIITSLTVDPRNLAEYLLDGWSGISYWAQGLSSGYVDGVAPNQEGNKGVDPAGFVVQEDEEAGGAEYRVSWRALAEALAVMASGHYVDHDGNQKELRAYHVNAARGLLTGAEYPEYDADTWDTALQMAALGKVVYG